MDYRRRWFKGLNLFSKRFILGGVYSTTLGYWISSANRSNEQTEKFLDKRLEDVKNLGKASNSSYQYLEKVKTNLFNIVGKKYFFPLIDWAMHQEDKIIKKGLITSDGWNEKLKIFNHLFAPLTSCSRKNKDNSNSIKIINPNKEILLIFEINMS